MTTHAGPMTHTPSRPSRAETNAVPKTRSAGRAARRAFGSRRVWPALVAALLLTAAGVLTAIEVISSLADSPARLVDYPRVTSWAVDTPWDDWWVRTIAAAMALLGLVFLLGGLFRGRSRVIPLRGDSRDLMMGVTPNGLKTVVSKAAEEVDGVTGSGVKLRRRKVVVAARTAMREPGDLRKRVKEAVRERLDEVDPMPRRRVAVKVKTGEG
ncbi:DUF6286 domain-containing protein [Spirillospora sp. CA-294931]|uniref:DUF6286 domain-containing protein n=1 Tax=Spirillospora sp. CA-294931 TaxID=3240042 RepID=UPI003D943535